MDSYVPASYSKSTAVNSDSDEFLTWNSSASTIRPLSEGEIGASANCAVTFMSALLVIETTDSYSYLKWCRCAGRGTNDGRGARVRMMYAASLYDVYLREKDMEGNGKERKYCILFHSEGRYLHFLSFSLLRRHVFQRRTSSIPFQNMKVKSPHDTSKHWTVYGNERRAGAYFFRGKIVTAQQAQRSPCFFLVATQCVARSVTALQKMVHRSRSLSLLQYLPHDSST